MKKLVIIAVLFANGLTAQELKFDNRFIESLEKWVAFAPDSTGTHPFGFIFLDEMAGLTLHYTGTFTIDKTGTYHPELMAPTKVARIRLPKNETKVAHLPDNKLRELKVAAQPDWLVRGDETEAGFYYNRGYLHNAWGECQKALDFLEKADKLDPKYPRLAVELAYSYNCLERYADALKVLERALKESPDDSYVTKEYIYSLARSKQPDKAKTVYKKSLDKQQTQYQAENAYNILLGYLLLKDKPGFNNWLAETNSLYSKNPQLKQAVEMMVAEMQK